MKRSETLSRSRCAFLRPRDRFYETLIRQADDLYDQHLDILKREALDDGEELL